MALDERERGAGDEQKRREIEELKFLVGTSCSRLINLLMDRGTPLATLTTEVSFMAERAGRLAELLEAAQPEGAVGATAPDAAEATVPDAAEVVAPGGDAAGSGGAAAQ